MWIKEADLLPNTEDLYDQDQIEIVFDLLEDKDDVEDDGRDDDRTGSSTASSNGNDDDDDDDDGAATLRTTTRTMKHQKKKRPSTRTTMTRQILLAPSILIESATCSRSPPSEGTGRSFGKGKFSDFTPAQ